jgi:N-glycosylase/DNA lyase
MSFEFHDEIRALYMEIREAIRRRMADFRELGRNGSENDLFYELVFCLLTPASRAHAAWSAVKKLKVAGLLDPSGPCSIEKVAGVLNIVRFRNTKAQRISDALRFFSAGNGFSVRSRLDRFPGPYEKREWLVNCINGLGYKEASHFLRNIGLSGNTVILDRHVLRNLARAGVIDDAPESLGRKRYLAIEKDMVEFSLELNIPVSHLDFVLWYRETGEIFK